MTLPVIPSFGVSDPVAYRDDMAHAADILGASDEEGALDYVAQFLRGVARSASDTPLLSAAEELARKVASYPGVNNVFDDLPYGKEQWIFSLTTEGRSAGLTSAEVGRQLRAAFENAYADSPFVSVVSGTPRLKSVVGNRLMVIEGLAGGEIIAVAGVSFLEDGQKVKLLNPEQAQP